MLHKAHAILLTNGHIDIIQCTFTDNAMSSLSAFKDSSAYIKQTKFENSENGSIILSSNSTLEVNGSIITGKCDKAAISIDQGSNVTLRNLSILDVTANGILTNDKAVINIENVGIKGAKLLGCQIHGDVEINAQTFIITECERGGFLADALKGILTDVSIFNCKFNLVQLGSGCEGMFVNLRLSTCEKIMLLLMDSKTVFQTSEFSGPCSSCVAILGAESKPQFIGCAFAPECNTCVIMQDGSTAFFSQCAITAKKTGIQLQQSNCLIREVKIAKSPSFGIFMSQGGDVQIDRSFIIENQKGIVAVDNGSKMTITNTQICDNDLGLFVQKQSLVTLESCQLTNNKIQAQVAIAAQMYIANCDISRSKLGVGVHAVQSLLSIKNSNLHDEEQTAVKIESQSACEIVDSVISNCGITAVYLQKESKLITSGTKYDSNQNCGLYITDTSEAQVAQCIFSYNRLAAIVKSPTSQLNNVNSTFVENGEEVQIQ